MTSRSRPEEEEAVDQEETVQICTKAEDTTQWTTAMVHPEATIHTTMECQRPMEDLETTLQEGCTTCLLNTEVDTHQCEVLQEEAAVMVDQLRAVLIERCRDKDLEALQRVDLEVRCQEAEEEWDSLEVDRHLAEEMAHLEEMTAIQEKDMTLDTIQETREWAKDLEVLLQQEVSEEAELADAAEACPLWVTEEAGVDSDLKRILDQEVTKVVQQFVGEHVAALKKSSQQEATAAALREVAASSTTERGAVLAQDTETLFNLAT